MAFNYGKQELSIGSLTLELTNCNFNPEGDTLFGYKRFINDSFVPDYEYNIFGTASVKQSYNETGKFSFEWSLLLETELLYTLILIRKEQNKAFSNGTGGGVTLKDSRLALAEESGSFTRPEWTTSGILLPTISLPTGYSWYYPEFTIGFQDATLDKAEALLLQQPSNENWLYTLDLKANEI